MIQEDAIKTFEKAPQEKGLDTVFFRALKGWYFLLPYLYCLFVSLRSFYK